MFSQGSGTKPFQGLPWRLLPGASSAFSQPGDEFIPDLCWGKLWYVPYLREGVWHRQLREVQPEVGIADGSSCLWLAVLSLELCESWDSFSFDSQPCFSLALFLRGEKPLIWVVLPAHRIPQFQLTAWSDSLLESPSSSAPCKEEMEIIKSALAEEEKFRSIFAGPPIPALLCFLGIPLLLHHILPSCCFILTSPFQPCPLQTWVKSTGKRWFKCSAGLGPALVGFTRVLEPGLNPQCHRSGLQLNIKISISAQSKNLCPAAPSGCKHVGRWGKSTGFPSQLKAWLVQAWQGPVALQGKHPWNFINNFINDVLGFFFPPISASKPAVIPP